MNSNTCSPIQHPPPYFSNNNTQLNGHLHPIYGFTTLQVACHQPSNISVQGSESGFDSEAMLTCEGENQAETRRRFTWSDGDLKNADVDITYENYQSTKQIEINTNAAFRSTASNFPSRNDSRGQEYHIEQYPNSTKIEHEGTPTHYRNNNCNNYLNHRPKNKYSFQETFDYRQLKKQLAALQTTNSVVVAEVQALNAVNSALRETLNAWQLFSKQQSGDLTRGSNKLSYTNYLSENLPRKGQFIKSAVSKLKYQLESLKQAATKMQDTQKYQAEELTYISEYTNLLNQQEMLEESFRIKNNQLQSLMNKKDQETKILENKIKRLRETVQENRKTNKSKSVDIAKLEESIYKYEDMKYEVAKKLAKQKRANADRQTQIDELNQQIEKLKEVDETLRLELLAVMESLDSAEANSPPHMESEHEFQTEEMESRLWETNHMQVENFQQKVKEKRTLKDDIQLRIREKIKIRQSKDVENLKLSKMKEQTIQQLKEQNQIQEKEKLMGMITKQRQAVDQSIIKLREKQTEIKAKILKYTKIKEEAVQKDRKTVPIWKPQQITQMAEQKKQSNLSSQRQVKKANKFQKQKGKQTTVSWKQNRKQNKGCFYFTVLYLMVLILLASYYERIRKYYWFK